MKKNIFPYILTAASLFAIVSCSVKELAVSEQEETQKVHFVINSSSPETKTYIDCVEVDGKNLYEVGWHNNDELAVFISDISGSTSSVEYTFVNTKPEGTEASFEGDADIPASGSGEFCSFYPASAFVKGYADGTVGVNIGVVDSNSKLYVQSPVAGSFDNNSDILIGKKCAYESDGELVVIDDMYFTRPLSILKVNLLGSYAAGDVVKSFKLTAPEGTVLGGRAKLNLADYTISDWTVKNNYVYAEVDNANGDITINGNDNAIYLFVNPTTISKTAEDESQNSVTFEIETDKNTITKTVPLSKDLSFPAGNIAVINLTILEANCTPKDVFTPKTYNKITDASQLGDGEYIICMQLNGEDDVYYLENTVKSKPGGKAFANGIALSTNGNTITISSEQITDATWTLASVDGGYSITPTSNVNAGLATTSANDGLTCQTSYSGKAWTIEDDATYNWTLKYNDTNRYLVVYSITNPRTYTTASMNAKGVFYIYQLDDKRTALSAPTGLSVSGKTLTWNPVSGAASYIVTIGSTVANDITDASYTFTGEDGYYDVSVVAVPSDTENNKDSEAATLSEAKFGTPTISVPVLADGGVTTTSVTAIWTDDANATNGYHCEIFNGETKVSEQDVAKGVQKVTFTGLTEDITYTVKVNAVAVTGDKPYAASAVATINLVPDGLHAEDVTAAGSYIISDLEVKVTMGTSQFIAGDATGLIYVYKSNHNLSAGDVITVDGAASAYSNNGGILQFNSPTITVQSVGDGTANHGTATDISDSYLNSYANSPVPVYIQASGYQDGQNISVGTKVLHLYAEHAATDGKMVNVSGYLYGYSSRYSNYNFVAVVITEDASIPTLETTPTDGSTISWDDDKFGSANAETITVELNGAASGYSVNFTDTENAWTVSDDGDGTITVFPNSANTSTDADKVLVITITHKDDSSLTSAITLKQTKQSTGGGDVEVLREGFDDTTTSDSSTAFSSSKFQNFNGATSKAYTSQYGGVKLGSSNAVGYITSKTLDLSKSFSVKINVLKYSTDTGKVQVTVGTITKEITPTDEDTQYTLDFDAATSTSTVKIGTSSKRAYIDNVIIIRHD